MEYKRVLIKIITNAQVIACILAIIISCIDYKYIDTDKYRNCLFYLDPPYIGTTQYKKQLIDYDEFYLFCRRLSENNIVIISEYTMPDDFKCIWQKDISVCYKSNREKADIAVERLFTLNKE